MKHIFLEILKNKKYYDEENDETIEIYNKCTKIKVIQKDRYYFYDGNVTNVYIKKGEKCVKTKKIVKVSDLVVALGSLLKGRIVRYNGYDYRITDYGGELMIKKFINDAYVIDTFKMTSGKLCESEIIDFNKNVKTKYSFLDGNIVMITKNYLYHNKRKDMFRPCQVIYERTKNDFKFKHYFFIFGKKINENEAKLVIKFLNNETYDNFEELYFYLDKKKLLKDVENFYKEINKNLDNLNVIKTIYKLEESNGNI